MPNCTSEYARLLIARRPFALGKIYSWDKYFQSFGAGLTYYEMYLVIKLLNRRKPWKTERSMANRYGLMLRSNPC